MAIHKNKNREFTLVVARTASKRSIDSKKAVAKACKEVGLHMEFTDITKATKTFNNLYAEKEQAIAICMVVEKTVSKTMLSFVRHCVTAEPFIKIVFLIPDGKEAYVTKAFSPYALMGIDYTIINGSNANITNLLRSTSRIATLRKRQQTALSRNSSTDSNYALGEDVLEYRKYETQEQYLGALLPAMNMAVVVVNPKGKVEIWNSKAEKYFGITTNKALGSMFSSLGGKNWKEVLKRISTEMKKTKVATLRLKDHKLCLEKGKEFYADIHFSELQDANGQVIGSMYLLQDVTLIREVDKAKTEFVSLASHQLRMPISTINWFSQTLLTEQVAGPLNTKQKEYVVQIEESSKRMTKLIDTLLNVSRIELGTFEVNAKETPLKKILKPVIDPYADIAKEKGIHMRVHYANTVPKNVIWDENLVEILLGNLISNAIKYTPSGGTVDVFVTTHTHSKKKKALLISVVDTGYGIPKKEQSKIFSKLFRAENVISKDTDGTGLGLYLVKLIASHIGVKIWFTSPADSLPFSLHKKQHPKYRRNSQNKGSAFHLSFPLLKMSVQKK